MKLVIKQNGKEVTSLDDVFKISDKGGAYEITLNGGEEQAVFKAEDIVLELY